jgi:two-component system, NtrC family, sensor kinase
MKKPIICLFILISCNIYSWGQDSLLTINANMVDSLTQTISLASFKGWVFKKGNDTLWKKANVDPAGWIKLQPSQLSIANADNTGRLEGWLRFRFKLDSSFDQVPIGFQTARWAATDIYLDGKRLTSYGNTGINGKPYIENRNMLAALPEFYIKPMEEHTLAVHVVDYPAPLNRRFLKTETFFNNFTSLIVLILPSSFKSQVVNIRDNTAYSFLFCGILGFFSLLFWFLYLQNTIERNLLLVSLSTTFFFLWLVFITASSYPVALSFDSWWLIFFVGFQLWPVATAAMIITMGAIFNFRHKKALIIFGVFFVVVSIVGSFYRINNTFSLHPLSAIIVQGYILFTSWKKLRGAQWAVVGGVIITTIFSFVWASLVIHFNSPIFPNTYLYQSLQILSYPASLMIYVAIRFNEIISEVRTHANEVVKITEEKRDILSHQNERLEKLVDERTYELRASQAQLIQSEKMASLGELTAGIAHEIQNPLNFVNNFSEVTNELVDEMKIELATGNQQLVTEIADDIKDNLIKINHHGQRASDIVKGMLQHSRTSTGQKELTDINALCDEYLRLSYHGLRAKDKSFNAKFETDFDSTLPKINVIPQDIGRMILNLINNAFYAVNEKAKQGIAGYEPTVTVTTKRSPLPGSGAGGEAIITVKDNGNGIPDKIKEKIFQPFFTTKPTGQGTGLGLSLSYDIVKAHGGELRVETKEGSYTEFIFTLPQNLQR